MIVIWFPGHWLIVGNCIVNELAVAGMELAIFVMLHGIGIPTESVNLGGSISLAAGGYLQTWRTIAATVLLVDLHKDLAYSGK